MSEPYRIGRLKGRFVITFERDGKRQRHRLDSTDARGAANEAPSVYAILTRPKGKTVNDLWHAYCSDKSGRAVIETMRHTWKALVPQFGALQGDSISVADCRAHIKNRRDHNISDGTIHTELGHLRTVVRWAEKQRLIERASYIERPAKPAPKEAHLTREQARALRHAAVVPHVKLFIILAQTTGARTAALLDLRWNRIDFGRGEIDLRNPDITVPHKGRAIVPMNRDARAALQEAKRGALTDYVIEYAGRKVKSVKRGLRFAAKKAGLGHVSPHMLRHSAAVHMAEAGIPLIEIAQFLGHSDLKVTFKTYARFSPTHLRKAASVLEYDDLGSTNRRTTTRRRAK